MKVKILGNIWEYDKDSSIEQLFNQIDQLIEASDYHFSHMIIDEVEVFEEYKDYISINLDKVEMVEIVVKTLKELVYGIFISLEQYLTRAMPELKILADEFYQGPTKTTWQKFEELIEGFQWLNQVVHSIESNKQLLVTWGDYSTFVLELQDRLKELQTALENGDVVLIGDILTYELQPSMNSLYEQVKDTINNEVNSYDFN